MPGAPCLSCSRYWHGFVALGLGGCGHCLAARQVSKAMADQIPESQDGRGAADHDELYFFGNPSGGLTLRQQARLILMRGAIKDGRGPIVGDSDHVALSPSGLWLPGMPSRGEESE